MQEITLALSGGAARGAYHLGVLEAFDTLDIKVRAICGTSIGAIVGASYACGVSPKEQLAIYTSQEFRKIFKFRPWKGSLFEVDKVASILTKLIPNGDLGDTKIPMFVSAVDLYSAEEIIFDRGDMHQLCFASSALVPVFAATSYEGMLLVDGGVVNHMPVSPLKSFNLPIVGVNLHPREAVSTHYSWWQMIRRVHFINTFSSAWTSEKVCDILIAPLVIREFRLFSLKHLERMFELGYQETIKRFS